MIIFNEGQPDIEDDDRVGAVNATLGGPDLVAIPVFGITYALGAQLVALDATPGVTMHMATDAAIVTRQSANVLADTAGGRPDRTVVVGAHLDSVAAGPGINDNGSGIAAVLEIARQVAALDLTPRNRIRFALWGGEEFGLLGAEHYVASLPAKELKNIAVNLNFDMIGSPNWVPFVYDGDGSATGAKGPSGSGNVETVFTSFLASQGVTGVPTAFDGRSDYGPFIAVGIPAGGLFTGAEGIKTAAEAAAYGGTAGLAYDPCYHQACDTFANVSSAALDLMADAAAHATYELAMTTSAVNGTSKASVKTLESGLDSLLYRGNRQQR
jgi:Zn-dependent M28 family amino/carboxypeptidase